MSHAHIRRHHHHDYPQAHSQPMHRMSSMSMSEYGHLDHMELMHRPMPPYACHHLGEGRGMAGEAALDGDLRMEAHRWRLGEGAYSLAAYSLAKSLNRKH